MKTVSTATIVGLVISIWTVQASAELSVRFMESATISTPEFSLADIAQVQTEDPGVKAKLEAIKLGLAPRLGYTERIARREVAQRIEKLHPEIYRRVSWTGSEKTSIRSVGARLGLAPFVDQARDLLSSGLRQHQDNQTRLEIEPVQPLQAVNVPRGTVSVTPRITSNVSLKKRMCAWLDIAVNGRHHQTVPVWFALKAYRPVLVAKRPLSVHQTLRPKDLAIQVRDIAGISNALTDLTGLPASMWLKRPLREGATITADDMEETPLVRSGQSVHVTLEMGPVQIETEGVAQIYGRLGDIVRVQNIQTKGIYAARVTGLDAVTVSMR